MATEEKSTGRKSAELSEVRKTTAEAKSKAPTVDDYIQRLEVWQQDIIHLLIALVAKAEPRASAYIKWGYPVWDHCGPFMLAKPYGGYVIIGFWRGGQLRDVDDVLVGEGTGMRYAKIKPGAQVPSSVAALVREAAALNEKHSDPSKW